MDYDCRIVFNFVQNIESGKEEILLIDIGTHDEVGDEIRVISMREETKREQFIFFQSLSN